MPFIWILLVLFIAVALWLGFWALVSFIIGKSDYQKTFIENRAATIPPNGFYNGSAHLLGDRKVPWLGKSFISDEHLGFNIFTPNGASLLKVMTPFYRMFRKNNDGNTEAYFFKTSIGPGFKDKDIDVFKLDYDSSENPFLIRIILDEMVELAPGQFLGKVHMKVFPGFYVTIGFFGLKKAQSP